MNYRARIATKRLKDTAMITGKWELYCYQDAQRYNQLDDLDHPLVKRGLIPEYSSLDKRDKVDKVDLKSEVEQKLDGQV